MKEIKKQHRFKVTLDIEHRIDNLCKHLPEMIKTDKNTGRPLYETFTNRIRGEQIPKAQRKQISNFKPESYYNIQGRRTVKVNHKLVMIDIYQHDGDKGIEDYLKIMNQHLAYEKIFKEQMCKKETRWERFVRFIKKFLHL